MSASVEIHVLAGESSDFADTQTRLGDEYEQRMVASSHPGLSVGCGQQRVDLVLG
jgi:hypothetical protein